MSFEWLQFLQSRRIEYFEAGPNIARGNVNVRCPWCGAADTSAHMGIHLRGKGWGCWRNQRHRGRRPERLIQALLGISYADAARIVEARGGRALPMGADFGNEVDRLLGMAPISKAPGLPNPDWPAEIKPLVNRGMGQQFYEYIRTRRGTYTEREVDELCATYGLRYATRGKFEYRVVFPVEDTQGLVSWTGRHIGKHPVRYRSLSADETKAKEDGLPQARLPINSCLFNQAELETLEERWPLLVIGEGPFDGMRLDYHGYNVGMRGSCLFGLGIYDKQINALAGIVDRFDHKLLLLDKDATVAALTTAQRLAPLGFRTETIQSDKDPADMSKKDIMELAREAISA